MPLRINLLINITLVLAAILFAGVAHANLLWEIRSDSGRVRGWLVGTQHITDESIKALFSTRLATAINDSDVLITEVCPGEKYSMSENGKQSLEDRSFQRALPSSTIGLIRDGLMHAGVSNPESALKSVAGLRVFNAAMVLGAQARRAGSHQIRKLVPGHDIDLMIEARRRDKANVCLETTMAAADSWDEHATPNDSIELILSVLSNTKRDEFDAFTQSIGKAIYAGNHNEAERLVLLSQVIFTSQKLIQKNVVAPRNKAWATKLASLLSDGADQKVLIAVGAGHLFGSDSLIEKLRNLGYRIEALGVSSR